MASLSNDMPMVKFLKNFMTIFACLIKLFAWLILTMSELIKLIQCAMHLILRMLGYFCEIILRAAATFALLSDIMAVNLSIPTLLITSSITLDIHSAVCLLSERFSRFKRYSFL